MATPKLGGIIRAVSRTRAAYRWFSRSSSSVWGPLSGLLVLSLSAPLKIILDQLFAAQISTPHMTAVSALGFFILAFHVLGFALGQTLITRIKRAPAFEKDHIVIGFVSLGTVLVAVMGAVMMYYLKPYLGMWGLGRLKAGVAGAEILLVAGLLTAPLALFKSIVFAERDARDMLRSEFMYTLLSVFAKFSLFTYLTQPNDKFMAITAVTAVITLMELSSCVNLARPIFRFDLGLARAQLFYSSESLLADLLVRMATVLEPLLLLFVLGQLRGKEAMAAFGVGSSAYQLLMAPVLALLLAGTPWLGSVWTAKAYDRWRNRIAILFALSSCLVAVPALVIGLGSNAWLGIATGLKLNSSPLLVMIFALAAIPPALALVFECQTRVFERIPRGALLSPAFTLLVGAPLALLASGSVSSPWIVALGIALPKLLSAVTGTLYSIRLIRLRRLDSRTVFPAEIRPTVRILSINGLPVACQAELRDLSTGGCGFFVADGDVKKFASGDTVVALIEDEGRTRWEFQGCIRHTTALKGSLFARGSRVKVGLEFSQHQREAVEKIVARSFAS